MTVQDRIVVRRPGYHGAVAASFVPGVSDVVVACADGRLYRGDPWHEELGLERIAQATPVVDMAVLPDGAVFLLDAHGAVHDADGQPVPGFIRQDIPHAKALAFTHFEGDPPVWFPPAWRTQLRLSPTTVTMAADPRPPGGAGGSAREKPVTASGQVEVRMTGAEEISGWIAEFQFSPGALTILEEEVESGAWWEAVPGAQVHASVIAEQGVLRLQGGSAAQPGSGATGDGLLAMIRLRPKSRNQGFSRLKLVEATVSHTSLPLHFRPVGEPQAITVRSGSRPRNMTLAWGDGLDHEASRSRHFRVGELVETAIHIEEGASLRRLEITLSYDPDILQPVVSHPGSCWRGRGRIDFRGYVRPGGRYKCVVQTGESDESEIGGEVLCVVWRAKTASPAEAKISIHRDTKVFSASAPQPTRLRIGQEPLLVDLR